ALLKTLEEPPEYVKFILSTTDYQKIPVTILSRCIQLHLKHISQTDINDQLKISLAKENINSDEQSLEYIAYHAKGS
ncbi:DNA polymerase III subunit gamma/tau, partial [Francisella tularensis subsp. holarctica]|nr:DNA polymerase III subunit gamma/tau [Francisella tularensis subsp. holarctica]